MSSTHAGSCLCGTVRFEVLGEFQRFYLCHCEYCRKDTGSAHGANLFSSAAQLRWLAGEADVTRFDLPGTRHSKCFCARCGSALPVPPVGGGPLVVPAGSLNSPVPNRPDAHLFVASRAGWDAALEQLPQFERFPA